MNQYLTKMKYRAQFNYEPSKGEKNDGLSIVKPGQSYSVKEALNRIQKGLTVSGRNYAYQEEDETEPPLKMKDLTDIDFAKQSLKKIKDEQSEAVKRIQDAAAKKAAESYSRDVVSGI